MEDGQRVDWRAIPTRYRQWQAMPAWRKLLWLVTRSVTMVALYALFAAGILWYNEPEVVGAVGDGRESVWTLASLLVARPELVVVLLLLVPAVVAGVILPHKPSWQR